MLLIIAGIGIIFFSKNYGQSNTVVRVQTVNINSKAKKIANYDVLANGKTRESHSTGDFSTAERIKVSPNIFDTYRTLAKSQGMKQLMAGGGVALIGITLVPLLSGLFG